MQLVNASSSMHKADDVDALVSAGSSHAGANHNIFFSFLFNFHKSLELKHFEDKNPTVQFPMV